MAIDLILYILAIFLGLVLTQEIFHRFPKFSLAFFTIASIIFFPCWALLIGVDNWFGWVKVLSIATGIIWLSLLRTTKLGETKLCQWSVYFFLVVNIFEAVLKDMQTGNIASYFNVASGLLLIATLAKINTIHICKQGQHKDLHWGGMTLSWIIGYTLWNWVFVYLNLGERAIPHLAVLGSALLIGFIDKQRWLQARAFTLGTYFIIFNSFPHLTPSPFSGGYDNQAGLAMSLLTVGFMTVYTIVYLRRSTSDN